MKQILIDKPEGLGFYPFISKMSGEGDISCISEAPPFYIENRSSEECTVTLSRPGYSIDVSLDYSYDRTSWTTFTNNEEECSFTILPNRRVFIKGNNNKFSDMMDVGNYVFSFNKDCNIGGNIMSLVENTNIEEYMFNALFYDNTHLISAENLILPNTVAEYCYLCMFQGCTSLTTAPVLPATTLAKECYSSMFFNCTSLTAAPELHATTLATWCYSGMFYGCTSLTSGPALPATTLANGCYLGMFEGCTSLTTAPALPATNLASSCYKSMFEGCTSLTTGPALPATILASSCYYSMFEGCTALVKAPALPATTLADYCYQQMFYGCTSLKTAPELLATTLATWCYCCMFSDCTSLTTVPEILPATELTDYCYCSMFYNCTSLTTAPVLPATELVNCCYDQMFYNCEKLTYIKAMFLELTYLDTYNWVLNVASSGTFVKNPAASQIDFGTDAIPSGWTVETAAA